MRRFLLAPALLLAGFVAMAPLRAQTQGSVDLSGPWKVMKGDKADWAKPTFDDTFWTETTVPGPLQAQGEPPYKGFAWLRKHVQVPAEWGSDPVVKENRILKLDIGRLGEAYEAYWNGVLVASEGKFPPTFQAGKPTLQAGVPSDRTSFGNDNVLAIRVFGQGGSAGILAGPVVLREPTFADYLDVQIEGKDKRLEFTGDEGLPFDIIVQNIGKAAWNAGTLKISVIDDTGKVLLAQPVTVDVNPEKQWRVSQKLGDLTSGLYTIRADIMMGGQTLRSVARTFAFNPKAIRTETFRTEAQAKAFFPKYEKFWADTLASLKATPLNPTTTPDTARSTDKVKVSKVTYAGLRGRTIYGWLVTPATGGPFPGIVLLPGFGNEAVAPPTWLAENGYAVLAINVHGADVDAKTYPSIADTYARGGFVSPDDFVFRHSVAAGLRAVDYLASSASVRADRIGVVGFSQGGGLAVDVAALDPRVKAVVAGSPMADYPRTMASRDNPVNGVIAAMTPEDKATLLETMAYFDPVILADKVRAPVMITAGMRDTVVPPVTAYSLKNAFETGLAVQMVTAENGAHETTPEQAAATMAWLKKFLQD